MVGEGQKQAVQSILAARDVAARHGKAWQQIAEASVQRHRDACASEIERKATQVMRRDSRDVESPRQYHPSGRVPPSRTRRGSFDEKCSELRCATRAASQRTMRVSGLVRAAHPRPLPRLRRRSPRE